MTYLLDTNAVSDLMRGCSQVDKWMSTLDNDDRLVICPIVRGEILFGIARLPVSKRRTDLKEKSRRVFDAVPCEPVPDRAGDYYAAVKVTRQRRGLTLDENDLWIAATALALGATLVSRDSDFSGIDSLPLIALA